MRNRIIIFTLVIMVVLYPIYFLPANRIMNSFRIVNKTCVIDDDCKMGWVDCPLCGTYAKGAATNKEYEPFCPLPRPFKMVCPNEAPPWYYGFRAVCEKNQCKEKATEEVDKFMNNWLYRLL